MKEKYPIFVKWTEILDWLLLTVETFPRSARFTMATKVANLGIEIMDQIIDAIYTKKRAYILRKINLKIEKLRIFLRISMRRHYITMKQYEFIMGELREAGRMIGGWLKVEANRKSDKSIPG